MGRGSGAVHGQAVSWEEFQRLDLGDERAEYVDGRVVMMGMPVQRHQRAVTRLSIALDAVLPPGWEVIGNWAWRPRADCFVPDVMVYPTTSDESHFTGRPALVAEVLSTNRRHDLVVKMQKYAEVALPHYWVVDPQERAVEAYVLHGGVYRRAERLTDEPGVLDFGIAKVELDPRVLLDG